MEVTEQSNSVSRLLTKERLISTGHCANRRSKPLKSTKYGLLRYARNDEGVDITLLLFGPFKK